MNLAEKIIHGRLDRQTDELETSQNMSSQVFESLPISWSDTSIRREILPDGTRGAVRICTQESQSLMSGGIIYRRYILKGGEIVTDEGYRQEDEKRVRGFKRAKLLAKIAFGKVDHWDLESDFHGGGIDY